MPVAVNCCVNPFAMLGLGGVTWIDTSVAAVTASRALAMMTVVMAALMVAADARHHCEPAEPAAADRSDRGSDETTSPAKSDPVSVVREHAGGADCAVVPRCWDSAVTSIDTSVAGVTASMV
jgi:hypothetical protein